MTRHPLLGSLACALLLWPATVAAQERGAVLVHEIVRGLGNSARVLMIGAHPDDEDTQLITWLARGHRVETAYLSLTRGDGGQNLIGNELGEALGVVRTEELLAARRIDGGRQYFTRAYDFGFSKSADETFRRWPREVLLRDVVTIVRAFRPHVIVSVFSGTPRDGHGHHQVAGLLAREVYDAAGDTVRFPAHATGGIGPWTPRKLYRGVYRFQGADPDTLATLRVNVGEYNAVIGRSYAEIAGESRSQHLSQGFGSLQPKGARFSWLRREASRVIPASSARAERSIFDGIDTSWARLRRATTSASDQALLDSLPLVLQQARAAVAPFDPASAVGALTTHLRMLRTLRERATCPSDARAVLLCGEQAGDLALSLEDAARRSATALLEAAGISVDAVASLEIVAAGDSVPVSLEVFNRGRAPVTLGRVRIGGQVVPAESGILYPDSSWSITAALPMGMPTMQWWRWRPRRSDFFQLEPPTVAQVPAVGGTVRDPPWLPAVEMIRGEDRLQEPSAEVDVTIGPVTVVARAGAIVHRFADPARGEVRRPVAAVPAITLLLERGLEYMPANTMVRRSVRVHVASALTTPWRGRVELKVPVGLRVDSAVRAIALDPRGSTDLYFIVHGRVVAGRHQITASAHELAPGTAWYMEGYVPIEYSHIRPQRFYRQSATVVSAVDVRFPPGLRVAYVPGVGDDVAPMLQQLGAAVSVVQADTFAVANLARFTTLVIGPRAYEAHPALRAHAGKVHEFARRGGTVVVQYGQYEMTQPGVLPYPISLGRPASRVTDEEAVVTMLEPSSRVLTWPNRISSEDFRGWVQERGLYMPSAFDLRYRPLLAMRDSGEPEQRGALLVTSVGRGTFVYTTLSFFRQLTSGVPGAARLFVNLMAAGKAP